MEHTEQHMTPDTGDLATDFVLRDSTGVERSLGSLVANGPCVLVFYRGHW
jgi:peroxiredoxin